MGILYRAKQFFRTLTAEPLSPNAQNQIEALLNPQEVELFNRYSHSDGRHAYHVLCTLQLSDHLQTDLAKAALLHDIGKTCVHLSIWDRSIAVLGMKIFPQKAKHWGEGKVVDGWQRPFVVKAQHAAWGAEMAAAAGSSTLTVNLIRRHQDIMLQHPKNEEDKLLALLQWADNQN